MARSKLSLLIMSLLILSTAIEATYAGPATSPATKPATRPADAISFMGIETAGKSVVYLLDGTGTMTNKMPTLRNEVARSLRALRPDQQFGVVFFFDGPHAAPFRKELVPATPDNVTAAIAFAAKFEPSGPTDPRPATRIAFDLMSAVIFFVTDGELNSLVTSDEVFFNAFVQSAGKRPAGKPVRVNAVLFDTYDRAAEESLQKLAKALGGRYGYVRETDLKDRPR